MRYKYVFNSPIKFLIRIEDSDIDDQEIFAKDLQPTITINLNDVSDKLLQSISQNFKHYINKPGILDIMFKIKNGDLLETVVIFDHSLKRKDFISLFTDIEGQLFAGIGKKFANMPIYQYEDIIEYKNIKGMLEKKIIKKNVFCLLWYDTHWKLKFISSK